MQICRISEVWSLKIFLPRIVTRKVPVEMSRLAKLLWLSLVSWNSLWKQRQQIFKSHRKKSFFLAILHFAHSCGVVFWEIQLFGKSSFLFHPRFSFSKLSASFHESFTKAVHIAWGGEEEFATWALFRLLSCELFFYIFSPPAWLSFLCSTQ